MILAKSVLAGMIDHTLLKPDASDQEILRLCQEAKRYGFASVCVNPTHVQLAAQSLAGTEVKVCTVIGFPLGASTYETKVFELKDAINKGATELDMVINIGALKMGNYDLVQQEISAIVQTAKGRKKEAIVKVIIETGLLTEEEIRVVTNLVKEVKADFVKTSTGFNGGAKVHDVQLIREIVGETAGVKASGGIRTYEDALAMIEAGANRIGTSAGVSIIRGINAQVSSY